MAVVGIMIMELSIIIPWFRSLTPETLAVSPSQAMLILGAVLACAYIIARSMDYLLLKISLQRGLFLVYIILSILFGLRHLLYKTERVGILELISRPMQAFTDWKTLIPPELIIVLTILLTIWRGISLSQKYIEPASVKRNFLIGVMAMILYAFINTAVTGETPGVFMYIFLSSGLFAMAGARIYSISYLRGSIKNPFDLKWFLGLSLMIVSLIGLSTLSVWLLSKRLAIIQGIGGVILGFFALVLLGISSPLFFLAQRVVEYSPGLADSVGNLLESLRVFREVVYSLSQRILTSEQLAVFFSLISVIKPILLWIFVGAMLIVVLAVIRRWRFIERETSAVMSQSSSLQVDILGLIRTLLDTSLQKFRDGLSSDPRIRSGRMWLAAARIRRIYARLMNLAADLGTPRHKSQTPLEYLPALISLLPEHRDNLTRITEAYLKVRYGELAETEEEVQSIEAAWHEVEAAGQSMTNRSSRRGK